MKTESEYQLRRAILTACKAALGTPCGLDDLLAHPAVSLLCPPREKVVEYFGELALRGYLANVPDSNGELKTITPKGLNQINQEGDRDFYVWGKYGFVS